MAFKKKRSYFGRKAKSGRSKRRSGGLSPVNVMLAGAIYGAVRPHVAKVLPDLFNINGIVDSDGAIIGGAGFMGMKKGKGLVKALGTVALASEIGIVAARLSSGVVQNNITEDTFNY